MEPNSSLLISQLLLSKVHHLAGMISLVAGLIAMAVPKASLGHRRSGRIALIAEAEGKGVLRPAIPQIHGLKD
jgi:hypothetical protein